MAENILENMGAQICNKSDTAITALFLLRRVEISSNREGEVCMVVDSNQNEEKIFYPCRFGFGAHIEISTESCYTKVIISV